MRISGNLVFQDGVRRGVIEFSERIDGIYEGEDGAGAGAGAADIDPETVKRYSGDLIVTPKDIDTHVEDISRVIGYAVNLSLHSELTLEDVSSFLA